MDGAFEIFDEDTTRKIVEEHQRDMEEAARAIGSHRMGFITGGDSQGGGKSSGGGMMGRLSGMASMFSAAKTERSQAQEGKGSGLMGKATPVDPDVKVLPFNVREPSLGAAVVGHVTILEGSCYVWASTEGSAAQGSLAAAVSTRFGGGMPTATPLLSGSGGADAGGGGVSVSMAQRLCKRTGRVVFVSCDLSEDSQILVAAIEAKVVALLKAEG